MTVGGGSWTQVNLPNPVSGGYMRWRPVSAAYCYAVVVHNTSNDGTLSRRLTTCPDVPHRTTITKTNSLCLDWGRALACNQGLSL